MAWSDAARKAAAEARHRSGKSVYDHGAMRNPNHLSGSRQKNAFAADEKASRAMSQIDNGIHSGQINSLPALQRRHYENIAATLKEQGASADPAAHAARVSAYADRLSTTNPQFNRSRFIKASTP